MAAGGAIRLFVAAIDFGTTYSGYAYAAVQDLKPTDNDSKKIVTNVWNSGKLLSSKAPTCLLLTPEGEFDSFGYDAENKYAELAGEDEEGCKDWYYFYRFKMSLYHNDSLSKDMKLKDIHGKPFEAMEIFAMCIGYLKRHMFKSMTDKVPAITETDITYVLTVPAIWDDSAKQFMRKAAVKGGIENDQLIIALEPEAASIFCQNIPIERVEEEGQVKLEPGKPGTKYMIADLGGGTADITVHEKLEENKLKEVHRASGGSMGGICVDHAFFEFLGTLFGTNSMDSLKEENMEDFIEILREFESKKREAGENKEKINVSIPVVLKSIVKKKEKSTLEDRVKNANFNGTVTMSKSHKLQILQKQFRTFYHETVKNIIDQIVEIIGEVGNVETIVMVGGFSECSLIRSELKAHTTTKKLRIVIPEEPGLAVLKGAVLFGYMPETIFARVARKTYGIQSWPAFREGVHPNSKKCIIDGTARCKDVFFKYIEIGQEVTTGHRMSQVFQVLGTGENVLECTVAISTEKDPKFITDSSCKILGVLTVPLPQSSRDRREIRETFVFGETELQVHAQDMDSDNLVTCRFDLI